MVDLERIKELVQMMVDNDLVEVSLKDGAEEVNLRRPDNNAAAAHTMPHLPPGTVPAPLPPAVPPPAAEAKPEEPEKPAEDDKLVPIRSPMVGTFYRAPDPESPPFAAHGTPVTSDTVVCIVEAMKVFNEIKAEVCGIIERVVVQDQDPVEYGQALFLVRPTA